MTVAASAAVVISLISTNYSQLVKEGYCIFEKEVRNALNLQLWDRVRSVLHLPSFSCTQRCRSRLHDICDMALTSLPASVRSRSRYGTSAFYNTEPINV